MQDKIEMCKQALLEKFPDAYYTIKVLIWDDGDYEVSAIHGRGEDLHIFKYYSQEPRVVYICECLLTNAIKEDAVGNKYYVPDELIPYLSDDGPKYMNIQSNRNEIISNLNKQIEHYKDIIALRVTITAGLEKELDITEKQVEILNNMLELSNKIIEKQDLLLKLNGKDRNISAN